MRSPLNLAEMVGQRFSQASVLRSIISQVRSHIHALRAAMRQEGHVMEALWKESAIVLAKIVYRVLDRFRIAHSLREHNNKFTRCAG